MNSKVYLSGKITGLDEYKEIFDEYKRKLQNAGYTVLNPAVLPSGFEQLEYLHICESMIDVCDTIAFIPNWIDSKGANYEKGYARALRKRELFL